MWTTKAHWNAVALHGADSHVSAPLGRRFQNSQRQWVGDSDNQSALGPCIGDDSGEVTINAARIRPWNDDGSGVVVNSTSGFNLPAKRLCTGVDHIHALRMQIACKQNARALVAVMTNSNAHSFSNSSCFIQQRCTGNRQAGKLGNERLEVEQKLQTTLADFRLVRRVSRVPGRIFKQVALNDRWRLHTMIARTDEALLHHIAAHDFIELGKCCVFAQSRWQIKRAVQADGCRNSLRDQCFHGRKTERCKHCALVFYTWPDMTGNKGENLLRHLFILQVCRNQPCREVPKAGLHRKA